MLDAYVTPCAIDSFKLENVINIDAVERSTEHVIGDYYGSIKSGS